MTELRRSMKEDLQLAGYSPRTVASYIDTVRVLANYYHRSPDLITEDEIRIPGTPYLIPADSGDTLLNSCTPIRIK